MIDTIDIILAIIMKAPSSDVRNKEASDLLNYAFSNYETKQIHDIDYTVEKVNVNKSINTEGIIKTKEAIEYLTQKGKNLGTEEVITYTTDFIAPIKANTEVGKIEIINKETGEIIGKSKLYIQNDIEKSNFMDYFKKIFEMYILKPDI